MATKDYNCLAFKDMIFIGDKNVDQHSNLNLNHFNKNSNFDKTCSKSILQDGRESSICDLPNISEPQSTKHLQCWKSLNKNLSLFNIQSNADYDQTKKKGSKNVKNSTLSLHIAAYEDSTEAQAVLFGGESKSEQQKAGSIKDLKNAKQCFTDFLTIIQNSFEFPRQQNTGGREPEIAQFKTSQQLFNPNKSFPAVSNTKLTGQTGSEEKGFDEWNEVMSKDLQKLNLHCRHASQGIMGITETSDYGIVVQIVTSTTKKKYFVIAELKRACVTFVQNDDTKYEYDYLNVGKTVLVERNAANEVENLRISEVFDKYDNELVNNDGFIAKCIFRYDVNGKKEHDYFVGGLRIHNIECDFDDVESSEESDTSSDDDDSSDGAVEVNDDEEENGARNLEVLNPIFTLPNVFYGRIIVPKVLIDCRHRNDAFYARENVPFIWLPSRYVASPTYEETQRMKNFLTWEIPKNTISGFHDLPTAPTFRGCFIENELIFLPLAPHSLATYTGYGSYSGDRRGRELFIERINFDSHTNRIFIPNAIYDRDSHYVSAPHDSIPIVFQPIENGLFLIELDSKFAMGNFYRHAHKFCYVYDRYGVIERFPEKEKLYPIKIKKDFEDGKYLTVVEIVPLPKMNFLPRDTKLEIVGEGFVANDEMIFCKDYAHLQIYYSKDKFGNLELGTFGKISAVYDSELQRYHLSSFYLSKRLQKLEPIRFCPRKGENKICFDVPVKRLPYGYLQHDFFGIISVKPFRQTDQDIGSLFVTYVGKDPKYQTAFAENEELLLEALEKLEDY